MSKKTEQIFAKIGLIVFSLPIVENQPNALLASNFIAVENTHQGDHSKKFNSAFVSYAKRDEDRVLTDINALKTVYKEISQDIFDGDKTSLKKALLHTDSYCLFWSLEASLSPLIQTHLKVLKEILEQNDDMAMNGIPLENKLQPLPEFAPDISFDQANISRLPNPRLPQIKVLFVAASPGDASRIRSDKELKSIQTALLQTNHHERFVFKEIKASTYLELHNTLFSFQPDFIHFSGHGIRYEGDIPVAFDSSRALIWKAKEKDYEGGIVMETEEGFTDIVSSEVLDRLFKQYTREHTCQAVFLNSCFSKIQAETLHKFIPVVIGNKVAVGDKAAIEFAHGFYTGLGNQDKIQLDYSAAFEIGKTAINLANLSGDDIPMMYKKTIV